MCSKREKIFKKINPKLLQLTPKLSEDDGSIIDLDTDSNTLEDGAKKLMMRFFKNHSLSEPKKKSQNQVEISIASAGFGENGEICDVISEKLTVPVERNDTIDLDSEKPGRKWQKLKNELLNKISDKWVEEYRKRVKENEILLNKSKNEKEGYEEDVEDEDEEDVSDKEDESDKEEEKEEDNFDPNSDEKNAKEQSEDKEEENDEDDDCDKSGSDADDEFDNESEAELEFENKKADKNENESKDFSRNNDDMEGDEIDSCSLVPAYQPGGGLLFGGSELTQNDNSLPQNLLSPSLKLSITQSPTSKSVIDDNEKNDMYYCNEEGKNTPLVKSKLFQNSQNTNDGFDLDDAFEFCSGKFPDTQKSQMKATNKTNEEKDEDEKAEVFESESNDVESKNEDDEEEEEEEKENEFESDEEKNDLEASNNLPKLRKNIKVFEDSESEDNLEFQENDEIEPNESVGGKLLSDDEEEEEKEAESGKKNLKKKIRKNLHFSDDEDNGNNDDDDDDDDDDQSKDEEDLEDDGNELNEKEEENFDQRSVNYDSEENEIINPKEYFEKEAELSGSEVWSGDEDERGLDEYDVEEGDADNLDNDQVKSQLEKIHIRRVLDDDIREVRLIQEILFEDGDLYSEGKGRDRKFKWKNLGTFDDKENEGENKEDGGGNSSDEDVAEEEELRKIRHQKAMFLMEQNNKKVNDSDDEIIEESFQTVKVTSLKNSSKIIVNGETKTETFETYKSLSYSRGSFLQRNEEFLSRMAKVAGAVTDNVLGPKHSKNFVFAAKSPEKVETVKTTGCKRQNEESENLKQQEKRLKMFPPETDTGPSILDFLV